MFGVYCVYIFQSDIIWSLSADALVSFLWHSLIPYDYINRLHAYLTNYESTYAYTIISRQGYGQEIVPHERTRVYNLVISKTAYDLAIQRARASASFLLA